MGKSFKTHNDAYINVDGTHLQGYMQVSYQTLCDLFGPPGESDGYKVDAEWAIKFSDGHVATIYNWKNGPAYCGSEGMFPHEIEEWIRSIHEWHIGGTSQEAVDRVNELINEVKESDEQRN